MGKRTGESDAQADSKVGPKYTPILHVVTHRPAYLLSTGTVEGMSLKPSKIQEYRAESSKTDRYSVQTLQALGVLDCIELKQVYRLGSTLY